MIEPQEMKTIMRTYLLFLLGSELKFFRKLFVFMFMLLSVGYSASAQCSAPPDGFNTNIQSGGGSVEIFSLSPIISFNPALTGTGNLVYVNTVNSFTDPPATYATLPTANSVYSGSGQQLILASTLSSQFAPVSNLTPNTTYYFKSYSYHTCGGTTYVSLTDTQTGTLATCNFSDALTSAPVFGAITDNSMELNSFTALSPVAPATAPDGYIIRINDASSFSTYAHGTTLPTGDPAYAGSGEQVIYVGNSTTPNLNITGLSANTTYYFNIVAYYPACGIPAQVRYQQSGFSFAQSNSGVAPPSITFNDIYKSVGDPNFNLSASASDGSTVSFQILSQSGSGTTLSGSNNQTVTLGTTGTVLLEAFTNGATTQATLTITELATSGTYFMTNSEMFFRDDNGVVSSLARFDGGIYGSNGSSNSVSSHFAVLDGALWFSSSAGGANGRGVFTRVNLDGSSPTTFAFPAAPSDNIWHYISSAGGKIWMSRASFGATRGDLYSTDPDGSNTTLVKTFDTDLNDPFGAIVEFNGVLYGMCYNDNSNSSGGIYTLTPDGAGGYTYAVVHTFTSSDPNRRPLGGFTIHDNLLWYTTGGTNRLVAYDPMTNSFPHSIDIGSTIFNPLLADGRLYVMESIILRQVRSDYLGTTPIATLNPSFISNFDEISFDGEFIWGIGNVPSGTGGIYRIKPDGTEFEVVYTNPVASQGFRAVTNINNKVTTGVSFVDQTVPHASTITLEAQTNSTGAITYELIGDATSSTLVGDQFTAGNVGSVTVRVSVAEDINFNAITKDVTFTIVKADPDFTIADLDLPFGSPTAVFAPTANNYPGTITYEFVDGSGLVTTGPNTGSTISGNQYTPVNPGTETVRATLPELANFNARTVDFQFTIQKRILTTAQIVLNAPASLIYDASQKGYTVTPDGAITPPIAAADFDITYAGRNGTVYPSSNTAPSNGGDYTVTAAVQASNTDYTGSNSLDFTITPFATSIDLNLPVTNPLYTGSGIAISPFANDAQGNPTVPLLVEYSVQGAGAFSETLPVNVGTYDVRVNLTVGETNYSASEATGTFTIDRGPQVITFNPIPDVQCGETTIDLSLHATSSTGHTLTFASDNLSVVTVAGSTATIVGPGSATITASQAGDANAEAAVDQTQTLTIAAVQENYSVDNPADVLVCDGGPYLLPALTEGNYFSEPGGAGIAYSVGDPIATNRTVYVYGVSSVNATCTDENSFTVTIENLPIDNLTDVAIAGSYTLPALTNGNYFTGPGGTGSALNAGDPITTTQTIYIYNTDGMTGCTRETSFVVTILRTSALHFNGELGANYDYLEVPDDNSLDFTSGMTFEAWVNFNQVDRSVNSHGWQFFFGKSTFFDSYGLMLLTSGATKTFRFYHTGVGTGFTDYAWNAVQPNTWYHVAVTFDGSTATILIDGAQVASSPAAGSLSANTNPLRIGANPPPGNITNPYPFDGTMDEVRFWNVARTEAEVAANKDVELQGTESGLVLYYNFNEGTAAGDNTGLTQVPDLTANGNNASFNSFALTGTTSNYVDGSGNGVPPGLPQSITFNALSNVTFGDAGFNLSATASSGLPVSYLSSNTAVATVTPTGTVTIVGTGTTTITASQAGNGTYLSAANVNQPLTVDPFTTSISLNLPGTNPTYTGVGQGITPTANDASGNPTLTLVTEYSPQGAATFGTTLPIGAGTYDVRVNLAGSEINYNAPQATGTFTIDKAPLTARLDDATVVYGVLGANNHPTTYTGFVNGETSSVLTIASGWPAAFFFEPTLLEAYPAGSPVTGGLTWGANPETQITSDNYAITFQPGDILNVTPRPVNVTADNRSVVYGEDANTGNTVTIEPLDTQNGSGLGTGETLTGTVTFDNITVTDAGLYNGAIIPTGGLSNPNYTITYVPGNLTITPKDLTITADARTITYGDDANVGNTATYGGFITGENESVLGGTLSFANITDTPVGDYPGAIIPAGLTATNYNISFVAGELNIVPKALTITANNRTITYGEDANTGNTVTYSGFIPGESEEEDLSGLLTFANIAQTNAGTYTGVIVPSGLSGDNYAVTFVSGDLTVDPRALTVTADAQTKVYGEADPTLTYQITNGALQGSNLISGALARDAGENVGTYAINRGTLDAGSNYTLSYVGNDLTIGARPITLTADAQSKTYGDADPALTYQITTGALQGSDVLAGALTRVSGEGIGTYAIQQGTVDNSNYAITFVGDNLTIGTRAITVTADAVSKTYGDTDPAFTYQLTAGSLAGSDAFTGLLARTAGESVGTYALNQGTLAVNANYIITFVPADLTIGARALTITADAKSKTYGDADPALTYQITSGALQGSDVLAGALTRVAGEAVGTYAIQQGTLDNSNYAITYVGADLTIGTRGLTVTADAQTKVYGDADPMLTYQITSGSLATGDAFTGSLDRVAGEDARSSVGDLTDNQYAINQGTLALSANYDLTYVGSVLTITRRSLEYTWDAQTIVYGEDIAPPMYTLLSGSLAFSDEIPFDIQSSPVSTQDQVRRWFQINGLGSFDIPVGSLSSGVGSIRTALGAPNIQNYLVINQPFTINLTATARPITVTADPQTKTYGAADPTLTHQVTTGSLITTTNGGTDVLTGNLERVVGEGVGTYAINQGTLGHPNYTITYVSDDLTITSRAITVTADPATKTYGDADPAFTYQITTGALQGMDALAGALTRVAGENAGTYALQQGTLDNSNYAITFVSDNLTISARPLTVTADAQTKVYGDADPTLTYQLTSGTLQGMDALTGALTRVAGENVGTYAINQGTLNAGGNYAITYVSADLSITVRALTVTADPQTKAYGNADPPFTYAITNGALQGSDALTGALTRVAGEDVGTYTINQGTLDGGSNYKVTFVSDNLTINKRSISLILGAPNKFYGDADPSFLYSLFPGSSLVAGDEFSGALSRDPGEDVGSYAINLGTLTAGPNYDVGVGLPGSLTIAQRELFITADNKTKVVGTADPALTYTIQTGNLVGSDLLSGALTREAGETLGNYAIQQGTLDAGSNYRIFFTDGTFTITDKIPQTITFGPLAPALYGSPNVTLSATGGASGNPVTYVSSDPTVATVSGSTVTIVGAGTTSITASQAGDATYADAANVTQSLTVIPLPIALLVDVGQTKVYGDADPVLTYQLTGPNQLINGDVLSGSLERAVGEGVGTYAIQQGTLNNPNYNITSFQTTDFEITPRAITVSVDAQSKTYGDADPVLTYQITSGALQFSDVLTGTLTRVAGEDVGTYAIQQGTLDAGSNYALTYVGAVLTIGTRSLTVTADPQNKTYGDADPILTYTITSGALQGMDAITGSLTRVAGEDVGTYAINQGTLGAGANYAVTFVTDNLSILPRGITVTADPQTKTYGDADPVLTYQVTSGALQGGDVLAGALSRVAGEDVGTYAIQRGTLSAGGNYILSFITGNLIIAPRSLNVTADDQTKVQGTIDPMLTYTITAGTLVGSDLITGSLTRVAGEALGDYAIEQGTLDAGGNYILGFIEGTLTITDKLPQTITFGPLSGGEYGSPDFDLSATGGASGNPVTFASSDLSVATVSGYTVTIVGAGTTTITASQAGDATYADAADVNQSLTIIPRPITLSANAGQGKIYGETDPVLTYQVAPTSPLVAGDVLTGSPERAVGEDVGTYSITVGSLANPNYNILSFAPENFTITPREVTVTVDASQTKAYGQPDPVFTYQAIPALETGDVLAGALSRAVGEDVGVYAIDQGTLDNANYNITFMGDNFSITPRAVTVTADAGQTKVYGQVDPVLTYQASPALVTGDAFTGALTRVAGEDVGTYAIEQGTLDAGSNYAISFVSDDFSITTKLLTITVPVGQRKTYGDPDPVYQYDLLGTLEPGDAFTGALERVAGEDAGSYLINQGTFTAGSNYFINYSGNSFTIDPIALSITADDKTKIQGTPDPALTFTITSGALINGDQITGALTVPPGAISLGMYPIQQGTLTAGGNYNISFTEGTFTITDKLLQMIAFNALSDVTYGDANFTLTAMGGMSGNPVTFSGDNPAVVTVSSTGEVTIVGAGTVNITANQAGDATYAAADPVIQQLTVNPAALTITANDQTSTYGAAALPTLSVSYSGFVNSETESVLTTAPVLNTNATTSSNAGAYPITVSGAVAANYAISHVDGTMTVDPAALTITADDKSTTYGDAIPSLTLSYAGFVNSEDETVLSTSPSVATTALSTSDAGSYAITVSGAAASNYTITEVNGTLTIGKATLSVTADDNSKTYGAANPSFGLSYAGFIGSDDASVLDTAPSGSSTADATSSVGTYAITASGGVDNNYTFSYSDGTLTVNQATLSVTAADQSKTYGAANPSLTVTYSGFQNGDDATSLTTEPTASTSATSTSSVGTYAITASGGADDNYTFTYTDGNLTVNQATLSVTADDQSKTYGATNPSLTVTYSGFQNGDDATSLTTAPTASTTADATSAAGTYAITANGGAADNYAFSYTDGTLTVNQATLSVTADDQSKTYGAANPNLTLTYSGFQNGEDATSLTTAPTASTSSTSTSSVGTYAITASGGVDDNYTFTYTDGTLTVNQATLSVTANDQSRTYGAENPSLTVTYSGFQNGDDASALTTAPIASTTADATSAVGTYAITASGGADDNYAFSYTNGTLTVNQATLSVTVVDHTITYGDAIPSLTFTYAGFQNGEDETVLDTAPTASTTATTTSDAGAYSITVSGGVDNNYGFTYADGTLTINKADQTITFESLTDKAVGDADFDLTATATSGLSVTYTSSDETVAAISGSTVTILSAGTATITASQAGGTNFNAAKDVEQTLTVNTNIQGQTITFEALANQTYGASPIKLAATASSGLTVTYTSSDASVATVSGNTVTIHSVGTTTITASQAGNDGFTAANDVNQTLTIDPATLTVTANDQVKVYGEANPTLTLTYVGFVNGEDASILDTTPTISTTADASSAVGTYEIRVAGGSASNYTITPVNGTMTITKATLVATADDQVMRTGDAVPTLTISYSGFVNGDSEADIDIVPAISTDATSASPSGLYDILLSGGEDNNYELTLINGTLTIETVLGLVLEQSQIMIYPNPVIDKLYIDFPQSLSGEVITVQLFDLEGRKLQSKEVRDYGVELDVRDAPSGILILQMSANREVIRKRIRKD